MIERLYRAYFTEQRSVFEPDSLVELAQDVGLDGHAARDVLREGRYLGAVEADMDIARGLGISGVPFFVINGKYGVSGAPATTVRVSRGVVQSRR